MKITASNIHSVSSSLALNNRASCLQLWLCNPQMKCDDKKLRKIKHRPDALVYTNNIERKTKSDDIIKGHIHQH